MRSMNKKEYNKKYYKEHRDEKLASVKQYNKEHRDKILTYNKQYYEEHRDEMLAYVGQYYKEHRDEKLAYNKLYRETHKDKKLAYDKLYYERNKDKKRQQAKAWQENHREQNREIVRKHSFKRRSLGFVPLNKPFEGSEAHHICMTFVIYIPKDMHRSIKHSVWTGKNMEEINKLAWEELCKQRATNTFQCI